MKKNILLIALFCSLLTLISCVNKSEDDDDDPPVIHNGPNLQFDYGLESFTSYTYNGVDFDLEYTITIEYDSKKRMSKSYADFTVIGGGNNCYEYNYDSRGLLENEIKSKYENDEWEVWGKENYTYNSNNLKIIYADDRFDGVNWEHLFKEEYTYDGDRLETTTGGLYNAGVWEPESPHSFTYYADGNLETDSNGTYTKTYIYDLAGRLETKTDSTTINLRYSYLYDIDNKIESITTYVGVPYPNPIDWVLSELRLYIYDSNNRLKTIERYDCVVDIWELKGKEEITWTDEGSSYNYEIGMDEEKPNYLDLIHIYGQGEINRYPE